MNRRKVNVKDYNFTVLENISMKCKNASGVTSMLMFKNHARSEIQNKGKTKANKE